MVTSTQDNSSNASGAHPPVDLDRAAGAWHVEGAVEATRVGEAHDAYRDVFDAFGTERMACGGGDRVWRAARSWC
jgi:hypothetical protein